MSAGPIFVGAAPLPLDEWVRARAWLACGCVMQSTVKVLTPATAEVVLNRYGAAIAFSRDHVTEHIWACQAWLADNRPNDEAPEWYIDHEPGFLMPVPVLPIDLDDYDGQGKSRQQDAEDSMWVIAYGLVALVVFALIGLGLWWAL